MEDQQKVTCPLVVGQSFVQQSGYSPADEIDLFQLAMDIWAQRRFIVIFTLIATLLGGAILWIFPSTYQVSAKIVKPDEVQIDFADEQLKQPLTPEYRFDKVYQLLQSQEMWLEYQKQPVKQSSSAQSSQNVNVEELKKKFDNLSVAATFPKVAEGDVANSPSLMDITYAGDNSLSIGPELDGFLNFVNEKAIGVSKNEMERILQKVIVENENKLFLLREKAMESRQALVKRIGAEQKKALKGLDNQISARMASALRQRTIELQSLNESLAIAESLGIKRPTSMDQLAEGQVESLKVLISDKTTMPAYLLGTQLLQKRIDILQKRPNEELYSAEIEELETERQLLQSNPELDDLRARESDDAYIEEYPGLISTLTSLKQFHFDQSLIRSFDFLSHPATEGESVKPKRLLIVSTLFFFSLFIALISALVRSSIIRRQQDEF